METLRSEAFVLGRTPLTESSWIVSLFTRDAGLVRAVAKGARRLKSPLLGALEPMNHVQVEVVRKEHAGLGQLRSSDLLTGSLDLYGRWPCAAVLMAIAETLERGLPEHSAEEETFRLTGTVLDGLRGGALPLLAWLYFGAWFLRLHGVLSLAHVCASCSASCEKALLYDAGRGGWICGDCRHGHPRQGVEVPQKASALLDAILKKPLREVPLGAPADLATVRSVVYLGLSAFLGRPLASFEPLEKLDVADDPKPR